MRRCRLHPSPREAVGGWRGAGAKRRRRAGWGAISIGHCIRRAPTPHPSPPLASARGGRGAERPCRSQNQSVEVRNTSASLRRIEGCRTALYHRLAFMGASFMTVLTRVALAVLAVVLASPPSQSAAQTYPSKPVRMIVPFGAGGPADVFARVLAQHLSDALKQSFVIENRPGAGAIIGTDAVAKAAPDGYTLLVMSNTHTTNESLIPNRPYQLMRDFAPI